MRRLLRPGRAGFVIPGGSVTERGAEELSKGSRDPERERMTAGKREREGSGRGESPKREDDVRETERGASYSLLTSFLTGWLPPSGAHSTH